TRGVARHHQPGDRVDDLHFKVWMHRTYRRDATLEVVIGARLSRDGRCLGHAVADGHLVHAHLGDDSLHDFDWTRRASHHAGTQRRQVVLSEIWVGELRYEHGWNAIKDGCTFRRDGPKCCGGLKPGTRNDHARSVSRGAQIAHHHAEA